MRKIILIFLGIFFGFALSFGMELPRDIGISTEWFDQTFSFDGRTNTFEGLKGLWLFHGEESLKKFCHAVYELLTTNTLVRRDSPREGVSPTIKTWWLRKQDSGFSIEFCASNGMVIGIDKEGKVYLIFSSKKRTGRVCGTYCSQLTKFAKNKIIKKLFGKNQWQILRSLYE
ncbi:hypothetical protein KAU11_01810 [Candidatus Babeliales bacterium]|nr:hypothetical protein [Candidatus Babeliales bacterium]